MKAALAERNEAGERCAPKYPNQYYGATHQIHAQSRPARQVIRCPEPVSRGKHRPGPYRSRLFWANSA
jgi:hypothetical protein